MDAWARAVCLCHPGPSLNLQRQWEAGVLTSQFVQGREGFVYKPLLENISLEHHPPPRPEAPDMTSAIIRTFSLSGDKAGEFS